MWDLCHRLNLFACFSFKCLKLSGVSGSAAWLTAIRRLFLVATAVAKEPSRGWLQEHKELSLNGNQCCCLHHSHIGTIPPETAATPVSALFAMAVMGAASQLAITCVIPPTVVMVALFWRLHGCSGRLQSSHRSPEEVSFQQHKPTVIFMATTPTMAFALKKKKKLHLLRATPGIRNQPLEMFQPWQHPVNGHSHFGSHPTPSVRLGTDCIRDRPSAIFADRVTEDAADRGLWACVSGCVSSPPLALLMRSSPCTVLPRCNTRHPQSAFSEESPYGLYDGRKECVELVAWEAPTLWAQP